MVVKVKYENGVFRPLEDVPVEEGTIAEVYLPGEKLLRKPRSIRELGICGMWKDREDIPDGIEYVNRIRKYRREPERG